MCYIFRNEELISFSSFSKRTIASEWCLKKIKTLKRVLVAHTHITILDYDMAPGKVVEENII